MKLTVKGRIGQQELLEKISLAMNTLEDAGIEEYQGVNLYFSCYKSNEKMVVFIDGENSEVISNNSEQQHRVKYDVEGVEGYTFKKGVNKEKINLASRMDNNVDLTILSEKELNAREAAIKKEVAERLRVKEEKALKKREEKAHKEEKNQIIEKKCYQHIMNLYKITENDLQTIIQSTNWLTSRWGIKKYTNKYLGERAFRVTMRAKYPGALRKVYLFTSQGDFACSLDLK